MKIIENIKDLYFLDLPPLVFKEITLLLYVTSKAAFLNELDKDMDISDITGGNFFILETAPEVKSVLMSHHYVDIEQESLDCDDAYYIKDSDYTLFFVANNNNGGPTYIIHNTIVGELFNLKRSVIRANSNKSNPLKEETVDDRLNDLIYW